MPPPTSNDCNNSSNIAIRNCVQHWVPIMGMWPWREKIAMSKIGVWVPIRECPSILLLLQNLLMTWPNHPKYCTTKRTPKTRGVKSKGKGAASNASTPGMAAPIISKGLRHFSMKVCEKVEERVTTTYNDVADEVRFVYAMLYFMGRLARYTTCLHLTILKLCLFVHRANFPLPYSIYRLTAGTRIEWGARSCCCRSSSRGR